MVSTSSERRALGERLKRHRERRGITLESISKATKISVGLFAGLERGDCSRWPAGLYSRAYIRGYAAAIGLSPDEIVEDFVAAFGTVVNPDAVDGARAEGGRPVGTLRLGLVEEPINPARVISRAARAGCDLVLASSVAWGAYALLDASLIVTVGSGLAYHAAGRLISDEPLVWWLASRIRAAAMRPEPLEDVAEVAVGDAASTAA